MRKQLAIVAFTVALVASSTMATAASAQPSPRIKGSWNQARAAQHDRMQRILDEFQKSSVKDYAALGRNLAAIGVSGSVSLPELGLNSVSFVEAQRLYDAAKSAAAQPAGSVAPFDVPIDAFSVQGFATHYEDPPQSYVDFQMTWNFRDNYINGSAPDDAVGLATTDFDRNCYGDPLYFFTTAAWNNVNHNELMWINTNTYNSIIYNVRDRAQAFQLLTDHGFVEMYIPVTDASGCRYGDIRGAGYYEHNQDGSGGWSASIGFLGMNLSYSGSSGAVLKKSVPSMNPYV